MWVFTKYGFVSVACAQTNGKSNPDVLMIRARTREHLANLQERFPDADFAKSEILESVGTDYKYRLLCPKEEWIGILSELAREQTWSNFKNEAAEYEKKKYSRRYVAALHEVWDVMFNLQDRERR